MNKERDKKMNKERDKETNKERARKEKCCAMATSVVGGSDEQNDVSDGADPSWWRPLTECRPLYSTQQCRRPMITNTKSNTMQIQIQLHRQKRLMIISTMLPIILNTSHTHVHSLHNQIILTCVQWHSVCKAQCVYFFSFQCAECSTLQ